MTQIRVEPLSRGAQLWHYGDEVFVYESTFAARPGCEVAAVYECDINGDHDGVPLLELVQPVGKAYPAAKQRLAEILSVREAA